MIGVRTRDLVSFLVRTQRPDESTCTPQMDVRSMKTSDPSIKNVQSTTIVSKRGKGLEGNVFPRIVGEIVGQLNRPENSRAGIHIAGPPVFIYIDGQTDPKSMIFEIGFPIAGKPKLDPGFEVRELPATRVVSMTCMGPYKELEKSMYGRLYGYAAQHQCSVNGQLREVYLNSPQDTPADQLVTELQLPIAG